MYTGCKTSKESTNSIDDCECVNSNNDFSSFPPSLFVPITGSVIPLKKKTKKYIFIANSVTPIKKKSSKSKYVDYSTMNNAERIKQEAHNLAVIASQQKRKRIQTRLKNTEKKKATLLRHLFCDDRLSYVEFLVVF